MELRDSGKTGEGIREDTWSLAEEGVRCAREKILLVAEGGRAIFILEIDERGAGSWSDRAVLASPPTPPRVPRPRLAAETRVQRCGQQATSLKKNLLPNRIP